MEGENKGGQIQIVEKEGNVKEEDYNRIVFSTNII